MPPAVKKRTASASAPKKSSLNVLIDGINRKLKENGSVQRGAEIGYLTFERRPSGSLSLDIVMGGGLPKGAIVQYKGAESTAKTTTALQACALSQKAGENVSWSASEGFNKSWARRNQCYIPYSDQELDRLIKRGKFESAKEARVFAKEYDEEHDGWGEFVLVQSKSDTQLLEVTAQLVKSSEFGISVLDSAGAILSEEDDEKEVGDPTRVGGNAKILTHFVNKVRLAFKSKTDTTLIIINQVRDQIGVWSPQGKPEPDAGGGFGLKHGKDIDIRFQKGDLLTVAYKGGKKHYGREVKVKCEKNKTAPPLKTAKWKLYFADYEDEAIKAGTVDLADEVFNYGTYYGVIVAKGAWFEIEGERFQGEDDARRYLRESPEILELYRQTILDLVSKEE